MLAVFFVISEKLAAALFVASDFIPVMPGNRLKAGRYL
jgi:hypothetical protein